MKRLFPKVLALLTGRPQPRRHEIPWEKFAADPDVSMEQMTRWVLDITKAGVKRNSSEMHAIARARGWE
jgi:hypothetical protein